MFSLFSESPNRLYLGFTLGETLDYAVSVNELLTAGCRALEALVSKYFKLDGMDYETYTKPFDSTVTPIIDYGSGMCHDVGI